MNLNQLKNIKLSYFELMYSLREFLGKKHQGQYEVRKDIIKTVIKWFQEKGTIHTLNALDSAGNIAFSKVAWSNVTSFIFNFQDEERVKAVQLPFVEKRLKSLKLGIEELKQFSVAYFKEEDHIGLLGYFDRIGILNFENEDEASLKAFITLFADKEGEFLGLMGLASLRQVLEKQLKYHSIEYFIPDCLKGLTTVKQMLADLAPTYSKSDENNPEAATADHLIRNGIFRGATTMMPDRNNNTSYNRRYV